MDFSTLSSFQVAVQPPLKTKALNKPESHKQPYITSHLKISLELFF